jgi:hypothetical protein
MVALPWFVSAPQRRGLLALILAAFLVIAVVHAVA